MDKNTEKIALYAGSFDPITLGHLDVLMDGCAMFDKVIIAVAENSQKNCLLTVDKRINLIKQCVKEFENVEVAGYNGLTVEYAKSVGAKFLLRGVRSNADFEYEKELAQNNSVLAPDIKTVFVITKPEHSHISSSAVREIIKHNGDITKFVPLGVIEYFNKR